MVALKTIEGSVVEPERHLEVECRLLRAERDAARAAAAKAVAQTPVPRSNVPWIVGGVLIGLFILISFAWNMGVKLIEVMEAQAARQHEVTMAALDATSRSSSSLDPTSSGMLGAMLFLAGVFIVVGLLRTVWRALP